MRFVLDHDVDARLLRVLWGAGHEAWTAAQAGLYRAGDDEITIYAQSKDAAVLTHDREFSARRRRNPIGRHVQLGCREPDALVVVPPLLTELVDAIEPFDDVFAYVTQGNVRLKQTWEWACLQQHRPAQDVARLPGRGDHQVTVLAGAGRST